ncbi:MAG TPA: hypothetical protein VHW45_01340 [Candidatus Sulfotelmatobacter sp.]|jgi:hypothetical protein|nr:hypothetical protein [Candidatus Sulfotelmatobacter sp.]
MKKEAVGARFDEMVAQRVRAPKLGENPLQKALRTKPADWIGYGHRLPLKNPSCHREAYCRITQVHHSHKTLPVRLITIRGGTSTNLSSQ